MYAGPCREIAAGFHFKPQGRILFLVWIGVVKLPGLELAQGNRGNPTQVGNGGSIERWLLTMSGFNPYALTSGDVIDRDWHLPIGRDDADLCMPTTDIHLGRTTTTEKPLLLYEENRGVKSDRCSSARAKRFEDLLNRCVHLPFYYAGFHGNELKFGAPFVVRMMRLSGTVPVPDRVIRAPVSAVGYDTCLVLPTYLFGCRCVMLVSRTGYVA
ncbi:hypothetical protein FA15DRAFT_651977 [Coprinopsis marcescibilis]|uniref:Uncharacterized protein n=1 Tax=Coprinopsis marcescibilis TaxID=230819 RepID=A0A5C3L9M3_COPMA|nr:hypothetical protein FA15DRAFT_651977 [Coprinopsis marcescibilis]